MGKIEVFLLLQLHPYQFWMALLHFFLLMNRVNKVLYTQSDRGQHRQPKKAMAMKKKKVALLVFFFLSFSSPMQKREFGVDHFVLHTAKTSWVIFKREPLFLAQLLLPFPLLSCCVTQMMMMISNKHFFLLLPWRTRERERKERGKKTKKKGFCLNERERGTFTQLFSVLLSKSREIPCKKKNEDFFERKKDVIWSYWRKKETKKKPFLL